MMDVVKAICGLILICFGVVSCRCDDDLTALATALSQMGRHFKVLEAHWNHQFDDPDVHEELKKENHNNTVVAGI